MVRIELCLILFVIFWMVESQEIQITTKFLKDFFDYSVNVRFIVYLCWPKRKNFNIASYHPPRNITNATYTIPYKNRGYIKTIQTPNT